ncbi:16504_t:CDS:2, partial [Gigaspora rosea]
GKTLLENNVSRSVNGNEYCFNRNGEVFHYIMEFYRTGKLLFPTMPLWNEYHGTQITYRHLKEELDYLQINKSKLFSSLASQIAKNTIDQYISRLEQLIISNYVSFNNKISLSISDKNRSGDYKENILVIVWIEKHLVETFSELNLKWECQRKYDNKNYIRSLRSMNSKNFTKRNLKTLLY